MSFRAPRSMMLRDVAIKTRSLPMKKKRKEEGTDRKNREEKPRRNHLRFRQSRDELGGERNDDLVFTFS